MVGGRVPPLPVGVGATSPAVPRDLSRWLLAGSLVLQRANLYHRLLGKGFGDIKAVLLVELSRAGDIAKIVAPYEVIRCMQSAKWCAKG